jgi:hypothetical protein
MLLQELLLCVVDLVAAKYGLHTHIVSPLLLSLPSPFLSLFPSTPRQKEDEQGEGKLTCRKPKTSVSKIDTPPKNNTAQNVHHRSRFRLSFHRLRKSFGLCPRTWDCRSSSRRPSQGKCSAALYWGSGAPASTRSATCAAASLADHLAPQRAGSSGSWKASGRGVLRASRRKSAAEERSWPKRRRYESRTSRWKSAASSGGSVEAVRYSSRAVASEKSLLFW